MPASARGVSFALELGEHGLANQGATNRLELLVDDVEPHERVTGALEQVVRQKRLVGGGGDLGDEQRVTAVRVRLRALRVERMHAVTRLVSEREHAVDLALPVHQDERVGAVRAGAVGAATLALAFDDVDPARSKAFPAAWRRTPLREERERRAPSPARLRR